MERRPCPAGDHRGFSQAITASQEEVTLAFSNLTSSIGFFGDRGGTQRPEKPVFLTELAQRYASQGLRYGREMTFTDRQRAFVVPTVLLLNGLIDGRTYDANGAQPNKSMDIEQHIVSSLEKADSTLSFADSTKAELKKLIERFADNYPALVPALHGIFEVAGAEGFVGVIVLADRYIRAAKNGELNERNSNSFGAENYAPHAFIMPHQGFNSATYGWETECTGITTTKKLVPYLKKAALKASTINSLPSDRELYANSQENIREFREHMRDVARRSAIQNASEKV